jgi:hypothetical protein
MPNTKLSDFTEDELEAAKVRVVEWYKYFAEHADDFQRIVELDDDGRVIEEQFIAIKYFPSSAEPSPAPAETLYRKPGSRLASPLKDC